MQMNRFDCKLEVLPKRPVSALKAENGQFHFQSERVEAVIDCTTGLLSRYAVDGQDYIVGDGFAALVLDDCEDPWLTAGSKWRDVLGRFELMSAEEGTRFSGVRDGVLDSVRVVDDGEVRTTVEAMLKYGNSSMVLTYRLPKIGAELEVEVRVLWNEKDRLLKLSIPTALEDVAYWGQVSYGRDVLPGADREVVAQQWVAAVSEKQDLALTCVNEGSYGSDFVDGAVRLSLLRSPAYSGHPAGDRPVVLQDRFTARIEQGERLFRFWIEGGKRTERLAAIDRQALVHNEKPFVLSFFPSGAGQQPVPGLLLDGQAVQLGAFKPCEDGDGFVVRLFESTGEGATTVLRIPALEIEAPLELGPFEIKTLRVSAVGKTVVETDLLERPLT